MAEVSLRRFCTHCGSQNELRLGYCTECGGPVCAKCGNVQHTHGESKILHDMCLKHGESGGFSMIKFVK